MVKRERIARFDKPVHFTFHWVEKNHRRDLDNIAAGKKLIIDGLVVCGILAGDGWKHVTGFSDLFTVVDEDTPNPGVMVEIEEEG